MLTALTLKFPRLLERYATRSTFTTTSPAAGWKVNPVKCG
jgi:hypothetical protein